MINTHQTKNAEELPELEKGYLLKKLQLTKLNGEKLEAFKKKGRIFPFTTAFKHCTGSPG